MHTLLNRVTFFFILLVSSDFVHSQEVVSPTISLNQLRVIYLEDNKGGGKLNIRNNNSSPYLIQSWFNPVDILSGGVDFNRNEHAVMPFIISPPLNRLDPGTELSLRIRRTDSPLPNDRESVFYISVRALPVQEKTDNQMVMTVLTNIKLFYRPQGLKEYAIEDISSDLTFTQENGLIYVSNPTPYWITFANLSLDGIKVGNKFLNKMVPPFAKTSYELPSQKSGTVRWQLIDEDGIKTNEYSRTL